MNKYIIKNCPAYDEGDCASPTEHTPYATACQHIEDCVLKQIVKKCRKSLEVSYCPIEQEILELLDIQEVE